MLNTLTPRATLFLIGLAYLATLVGAWIFEYAGYAPCELCLMQRWPYYVLIPLCLVVAALNPRWLTPVLLVVGLGLLGSAGFGVYHSGVEWGWWPGPDTCGAGALSDGLPNLGAPAVLCTEAAIRIFGLSLAGWNAVISAALAVLAFASLRKG